MKKYGLIVLSLLACVFATSFADNIVSVQVVGNGLVIGTPEAVTLGTVTAGNSTGYTFQGDKFFWIRDLRGAENGHYTTIQCDGLYQSEGNGLITGVMLKSTEGILYGGLANGTAINPLLRQGSGADITEPQLYFYRNNNEHSGGVTNIYIDRPTITVVVPAGTPAGIYKGRITYTLYDTSFVYGA